jgi:hypothetical protein
VREQASTLSFQGHMTMTERLVQRDLFKGTQELEIDGEEVRVRIRSWFREENLTVMLTVLNPEPVIRKSRVEFLSRVNGEPLLSLYAGKPDAESFNAFVGLLKQRARDEYGAFTGLRTGAGTADASSPLEGLQEEDPWDMREGQDLAPPPAIDAARVEEAIRLLKLYLDEEEIGPLLSALQALKAEPESESRRDRVVNAFAALGPTQGAVLTYAPYLSNVLAHDVVRGR